MMGRHVIARLSRVFDRKLHRSFPLLALQLRPPAAYLYLPRQEGDTSVRTRKVGPGILLDYAFYDRSIGIEITSPTRVSVDALNSLLSDPDLAPLDEADLAPVCAT